METGREDARWGRSRWRFRSKISRPGCARETRIKPLLLNQSFLAGLGNIYVDEACSRRGFIRWPRAANQRARAAKLHQAIREILTAAIAHGGSSISDYVEPKAGAAGSR